MCGVAAIFAYAPDAAAVDSEELVRIRDHMRVRGPDGAGLWVDETRRVGLAHRRLSIIDLSERGRQPMVSADGRIVLTYNGEIYNYRSLRAELENDGHVFRGTSDTEVLLNLYASRGEAMFNALRGMYAFALWDAGKEALLLARDPFGIKPLYYANVGGTLRVASQVKALLASGRLSHSRDPAGTVGFFLFGSVPEPHTMVAGVQALPAGARVWCDHRGPGAIRKHFDLSCELRRALECAKSERKESDHRILEEAIADSIRHHMVADVPVAAFLSSGIDSCVLVSQMQRAAPTAVRTITLAFDEFRGTPSDEAPLAELAARHYRTDHTTRTVSRHEFSADLPAILEAMDQPSVDGINTWFVSKITHELGLRVAISGLGGDELFGGYANTFGWIPKWQPRLVGAAGVPFLARLWPRLVHSKPFEAVATSPKIAGLFSLGATYGGAYLLRRGIFLPEELPHIMARDALEEGLARLMPLQRLEETVTNLDSDFARVVALEASFYMRNQLLRDSDWASMAHSLELRVPLVDAELWRRVLPTLLAREGTMHKPHLAGAANPGLPPEIGLRPKTGFSIPLQKWLVSGDERFGCWKSLPLLRAPNCHWSRRLAYALTTFPAGAL
jgi:asparagine synthase (glutamine-hydrolysing)